MEKSTHRLVSALFACALSVLLAGCGGGRPVDEVPRAPAKMDAERGGRTEKDIMPGSSAREVRFGFFVFDNADGMYGVYSETHALKAAANVITDALTEAGGEFMYYILSSSNDSEAYCFRFEGSAAMPATTDTIHAIVKLLKGDNDIMATRSFGRGSVVYTAVQSGDGVDNLMLFEIADNGINLLLLRMVDSTSFKAMERVSFTDGTLLSDVVSAPEAATGVMRVGNNRTGFIDLPDNWGLFYDIDYADPEMPQYTDGSGHVVTLLGTVGEEVGFEGSDDELALTIAENAYDSLEANPRVESVNGGTQEFACGLKSYVIQSEWDDGTILIQFYIAGDGVCYYVACEGLPESTLELAVLIIESFDPAA